MLKRYRLFSEVGVRDLGAYNEQKKAAGEEIMPRVVIVIDELADLMMAASKEVEESICRVAQMGRAAGMHLVIATQRPSADVITGLMKANIPSRIAFAVSSAMESRIILDQMGAEKLVGMGDMLFAPLGLGKPVRIQGAFVSDEEREEVINFIKEETVPNYSDEIMASIDKAAEDKNSHPSESDAAQGGAESAYDELLPQAVDVIFDTKQASVSMLQRRLKLGYSRAARLMDQMEEMGIVGPSEGSKPRQVLITKEQWQEMQLIQGTAPTEIMETRMKFGEDGPQEDYSDDTF
jgi:S-DNA-T family DNA segregation ATPase FtsK/SpoIIIE